MKEIIDDLGRRGVRIAAFVCENEEGKLQVLSYNDKGVVSFISDYVDAITINEKLNGRMVRPIAEILRK